MKVSDESPTFLPPYVPKDVHGRDERTNAERRADEIIGGGGHSRSVDFPRCHSVWLVSAEADRFESVRCQFEFSPSSDLVVEVEGPAWVADPEVVLDLGSAIAFAIRTDGIEHLPGNTFSPVCNPRRPEFCTARIIFVNAEIHAQMLAGYRVGVVIS